jgi:PKD repeat protein
VKTHRYDQPGIYTIKVVAENLQGESSTVHVLTAEHPVHKNWKMTSDSPKLLPGDVKFIFSYPTDKILPTNATVILTFGDGKREIWHVPEGDWSGEHIISHEYEKPGKYNVQLNMSNVVSRVIRRFQVKII